MRLVIDYATTYRFAGPVRQGQQRLKLTPVSGPGQTVVAWDIDLDGATHQAGYDDEYGNRVALIGLVPGVQAVTIRAHGLIDTRDEAGVTGRHVGYLPLWHFLRETPLTAAGAGIAALIDGLADQATTDRLGTLHALSARVGTAVVWATGHTAVTTTAEAALTAGRGVCQDQAHVLISAARALGIPARYVSGVLLMPDRPDQQAAHAWAEAYVEGLGWVGFDVANAICPDDRYVRLACGRDYAEAAPIKATAILAPGDADDPVDCAPQIRLNVRAIEPGQNQSQSQG
jgi:transglutaminase-like putative cysteine protease